MGGSERVATAYEHPPLSGKVAQKLSGSTVESLDAFSAVEFLWVWLRRNVHHPLGKWNLPAQSATAKRTPPADFAKKARSAFTALRTTLIVNGHSGAYTVVPVQCQGL